MNTKIKNSVFIFLLAISTVVISYWSPVITNWLILSPTLSWTLGFVLPKILVLLLAIVIGRLVYKALHLKAWLKNTISALATVALIGVYLVFNLPYLEDYSKNGFHIFPETYQNNSVLNYVNKHNPDFNGVIALGSITCPYCKESARKFSKMHSRGKQQDIFYFLYTKDPEKLANFRVETDSQNLTYAMVPDQEGAWEMCKGVFPTYFYIKDQTVVYEWQNEQLGYPALSWIENKLN